jgi:hypothetical protein
MVVRILGVLVALIVLIVVIGFLLSLVRAAVEVGLVLGVVAVVALGARALLRASTH